MSKIKVDTIETLDGSKSFSVADLSDATYPIEDVLTSTNPNSALSANQGRVLKGLVDAKAPLASPSFSGVPTAPTAAAGVSTTQIASTAFVQAAAQNAAQAAMDGAIVGSLPTIRPSLLLDFANSKQVDPRITFARASTATYFDAQGVLRTAASGVPRIDHDQVTGECKGLLIEEARTNLLLYSEQFDNAAWAKTRSTITANAATAPDGTLSADKLIEDTSVNLTHQIGQTITITASATYVFTVFVKSVERAQCQLVLSAGSDSISADYDTTAETATNRANVGSGVISSSSITPVGNGWFRLSLIGVVSAAGGSGSVLFRLRNGGTNSYTGDGTSGLYLWGAQLELGAFATSVIPTTSAAATRAADAASMSGTNFSEWYRQAEGTFVVDTIVGLDLVSSVIISANSSATSNAIEIFSASAVGTGPYGNINTGGLNVAAMTDGSVVANTAYRAAIAYRENNFAFSRDGRVAVTDAGGTVPAVTQLDIGARPALASMLNGHIQRLAYYPNRLTNAELQALTA